MNQDISCVKTSSCNRLTGDTCEILRGINNKSNLIIGFHKNLKYYMAKLYIMQDGNGGG